MAKLVTSKYVKADSGGSLPLSTLDMTNGSNVEAQVDATVENFPVISKATSKPTPTTCQKLGCSAKNVDKQKVE